MRIAVLALVAAGLVFVGCEKKQEPAKTGSTPAPKSVTDKAADAGKAAGAAVTTGADKAKEAVVTGAEKAKEAVVAGADKVKEAFISGTQSALDGVKAQIKTLTDKGATASLENKIGIEAVVKSLGEMLKGVEGKLSELKSSSGDWEKIKGDVTTGLDALKKAAGDAMAKFGG